MCFSKKNWLTSTGGTVVFGFHFYIQLSTGMLWSCPKVIFCYNMCNQYSALQWSLCVSFLHSYRRSHISGTVPWIPNLCILCIMVQEYHRSLLDVSLLWKYIIYLGRGFVSWMQIPCPPGYWTCPNILPCSCYLGAEFLSSSFLNREKEVGISYLWFRRQFNW